MTLYSCVGGIIIVYYMLILIVLCDVIVIDINWYYC